MLQQLLNTGGLRREPAGVHALFGEHVPLAALRRLPAFQSFEAELREALRELGRIKDSSAPA